MATAYIKISLKTRYDSTLYTLHTHLGLMLLNDYLLNTINLAHSDSAPSSLL